MYLLSNTLFILVLLSMTSLLPPQKFWAPRFVPGAVEFYDVTCCISQGALLKVKKAQLKWFTGQADSLLA